MFNNINDSNSFYQSQLDNQSKIVELALRRANSAKNNKDTERNPYIDKSEISANAIELFQKDCDIRKFNQIEMSDREDLSHLQRMQELFADGIVDPYEDDVISELLNNPKLWSDLEL